MSSTTGYPIPQGPGWIKTKLAALNGKIDEVRRGVNEVGRRVTRAPSSGTTAERNAVYGSPTTTADRVALANLQVRWINTDTGWEESFYAVAGSAGLTVPGLMAGVSSGWYPVGAGPYIALHPPGQFGASPNNWLGNWSGPQNYRRGGDSWFTYSNDGLCTIKRSGLYDLHAWTVQQQGSGVANYHFKVIDGAGNQRWATDGNASPLQASFYTRASMSLYSVPVVAGDRFGVYCHTGTLTVHMGGGPAGQLAATYLGPALAYQ